MKIYIGADHGGFELKEEIKKQFKDMEDMGTDSTDSCDYPKIAEKVARKVATEGLGILICGTGIGMCMAANKIKGIRAAICYDEYTAKMAREHNNANILCLGGRTTKLEKAKKIVDIFLNTQPSDEERHKRRVKEVMDLE